MPETAESCWENPIQLAESLGEEGLAAKQLLGTVASACDGCGVTFGLPVVADLQLLGSVASPGLMGIVFQQRFPTSGIWNG